MVACGDGSLCYVGVVIGSAVCENDVGGGGRVVGNEGRELQAYVLECPVVGELEELAALNIRGSITKKRGVGVNVCHHVHGEMTSEEGDEVRDGYIISCGGLVYGVDDDYPGGGLYFSCDDICVKAIHDSVFDTYFYRNGCTVCTGVRCVFLWVV